VAIAMLTTRARKIRAAPNSTSMVRCCPFLNVIHLSASPSVQRWPRQDVLFLHPQVYTKSLQNAHRDSGCPGRSAFSNACPGPVEGEFIRGIEGLAMTTHGTLAQP
jgi:hypothetical protein